MNLSTRMKFEPVRSLGFGAIGGAYMGIGTSINHPARQIFVQNLTDVDMMFSFNGTDDHFPLPALGFFLSDIMSNKTATGGAFYLAEGERLYVKEILDSPTLGGVYFSVIYGDAG